MGNGFARDKSKDSSGFRGLIPEKTTVAVALIDNNGGRMQKLKNGPNAGKTARMFKPIFEVVVGKYTGGRIYSDVWCNVEIDPASGDPVVFGGHLMFCDLCDATEVKDPDGGYPVAKDEQEINSITNRMIGKVMFITVGVKSWEKNDGTESKGNTVTSVITMDDEQKDKCINLVADILKRVATYKAKKQAQSGGSGLEGLDYDGDEPVKSKPPVELDDSDMPF